jgi:hypothetical protein
MIDDTLRRRLRQSYAHLFDPQLFREREERIKQEQRAKRAASRKAKAERKPYTLEDMVAAQANVEWAEDHVANGRHNNPNRGRAGLKDARVRLSLITSDLQARGVIPKPEPTAKQLLERALDTAFPNAQSREEVEHDGKRYRRRFAKAKYGWDRWWEEVK